MAFQDNRDELTERIDFNITQSDHLYMTLGSSRNPRPRPLPSPMLSGFPNVTHANRYLGSVNYTKTCHTFAVERVPVHGAA